MIGTEYAIGLAKYRCHWRDKQMDYAYMLISSATKGDLQITKNEKKLIQSDLWFNNKTGKMTAYVSIAAQLIYINALPEESGNHDVSELWRPVTKIICLLTFNGNVFYPLLLYIFVVMAP
jgi:hypothetical protein